MKTEKSYERILIVEVNWMGDIIFSTPMIRAIRKRYKNSHIACMVVPRCAELLEGNPRIDEVILFDERGIHRSLLAKLKFILFLKKKRFDTAILLHRSFTRRLIMYLAGIKERIGYSIKKGRFLLTLSEFPPGPELHKVEYFLELARFIDCDISEKNYELFITDRERRYIEEELIKGGVEEEDFLVVLNPGANWFPKRWPEENFCRLSQELLCRCNLKIVISGSRSDIKIGEKIKEATDGRVLNFCGRTNLKQLAGLMERAEIVISGDSGPMHIAVAMGSYVIALFGPTSPKLTGPYGTEKYEIIHKDIGCEIPCYNFNCIEYRCMETITVEDVLKVFDKVYNKLIQNQKNS